MRKILVLNGSPGGVRGNCGKFIKFLEKICPEGVKLEVAHLARQEFGAKLQKQILAADGLVFVTGTYWDSWGSPLQKLLEDMTPLEGAEVLVGKPAAVFVLMHSVGGKGVLSRLQGVLSTMGLLIPPMSGMVYSLVSDIALKSASSHAKDFWQVEDAGLIMENLRKVTEISVRWTTWPVDKKNPKRLWFKSMV